MSQTFQRIRELVARGDIMISAHGYDELAAEGILVRELFASAEDAVGVEDYPDYPKGPCVGATAGLPRQAHPDHLGDRQADILASGGSDGLSAGSSSLVKGFHEETSMTSSM